MAELASELEKLLSNYKVEESASLNIDTTVRADAVSKFMNGEISFNDYLQQMEEVSVKNENSIEETAETTVDMETTSIASLEDFKVSESSDSNLSENDKANDVIAEKKVKKKKKRKPQKSKLSPTLRAVMGQANVCYAKGDSESAVKMCLEIIKEAPNASEPFQTLASIYEGIGEHEKSLQMRLIAAHLGPTDKEEWVQLASILETAGQLRQAITSLTRAICLDELDVELYEKRAALMKIARFCSVEDYGYHRLLVKLDPETDSQTIVRIRNLVATYYFKDKKYEKACETWKYVFDVCSQLVTTEEVRLYANALIHAKHYSECLAILEKYCGISFSMKNLDGKDEIIDIKVPEDTSTYIRIQLIMCLIHHQSFDLARLQIEIILKDDPNKYSQFFYDIAMFLNEHEQYEDALLLLRKLTESTANSSDIWFKITDCYKKLNKTEECFANYRTAVELFPGDSELKLKFCDELRVAGLYREAVEITLEDESNISLLIYQRCELYYLLKDFDSFIEAALQLFRLHYLEISTAEEYTVFSSVFRMAKGMRERLAGYISANVDHSVTLEEEWQVFLNVCNLYVERKEFDLLQRLTFSLWLSFKFIPKRPELRMIMTLACIFNEDYEFGFDTLRIILLQSEIMDQGWNLFYLATYRADYCRMHKFLIRYLIKNPNEKHALMLFANSCLHAGTYKYALNDYSVLYEQEKTPLLALLIAVNLLHISSQKFTTSKHLLVTQMIAFLTKYQELRGEEANQEVFYNIGRAFHQIELFPQAIFYYKKSLNCKPAIEDPMFDLTADAAFNLHLIYLNSRQYSLANWYLQKYVVI